MICSGRVWQEPVKGTPPGIATDVVKHPKMIAETVLTDGCATAVSTSLVWKNQTFP